MTHTAIVLERGTVVYRGSSDDLAQDEKRLESLLGIDASLHLAPGHEL